MPLAVIQQAWLTITMTGGLHKPQVQPDQERHELYCTAGGMVSSPAWVMAADGGTEAPPAGPHEADKQLRGVVLRSDTSLLYRACLHSI